MIPTWQLRETTWPVNLLETFRAYVGDDDCLWLDSSDADPLPDEPRFSFIAARPAATIVQYAAQPARLTINGRAVDADPKLWSLWRRCQDRLPHWPLLNWPLSPGWGGWLGYELAGQLERLPHSHAAPLSLPLARLFFFDRGIILDHGARRAIAARALGATAALAGAASAGVAAEAAELEWLGRWEACGVAAPQRAEPGSEHHARSAASPRVTSRMDRSQFERMVRRARDYIAAGDIYQVNLAHAIRLEQLPPALDVYAALRHHNPARYGAFMRCGAEAVASVSPELFLRVRGRDVLTRPIKGTRPRVSDGAADQAARGELLASEKDAAELAMIVDLHRNDLGRVCEYGSIQVEHARRLETHPTVLHTVADVRGRLADCRTPLELLAACFPAGSVTGVPKIRAMQIIDELEPAGRGVYTGAIGTLGLDDQMTLNVAIRTLQINGDRGALHVGGGIVADSDPAAEYEETLAKGRGILEAVLRKAVGVESHGDR